MYKYCTKRRLTSPYIYIRALFRYIYMIRCFKSREFSEVQNMLNMSYKKKQKYIKKCTKKYDSKTLLVYSGKIINSFCFWGRIFKQSDVCLERSIALAYALVYMGIPAELVIGKSYYCITDEYSFHAWVEIDGFPLNERSDIIRQWKPVCRYPRSV